MNFNVSPQRTGVYLNYEAESGKYTRCKLPDERFPLEFFKKIFDETPQTKLKINCLACSLVYNAEWLNSLNLHREMSYYHILYKYIVSFENPTQSTYILDNVDWKIITVPDVHDIICDAAERNYSSFLARAIHLVPQRTKNAALGYAANWGNLETVKVLVENGAEVKSFGGSALRFAQENGQKETIEYLLSCGA